jgi:hypothetical protein
MGKRFTENDIAPLKEKLQPDESQNVIIKKTQRA